MNTFVVTIDQQEHSVSIDVDGTIRFDNEIVPVDVQQLNERSFSLILNGESVKVVAEKNEELYDILVNAVKREVVVESERTRLLKKYDQLSGLTKKKLEIHAPMPALVVKVEVAVGDEVAAGTGLIILEAMKMENEIKAHHAGTVKEIYATPGKPVEKGELLMLLE